MRFPVWLPALLGLLQAVGPITTDMYLPAFPAMEADLGGEPGAAQITLATWFIGLAFGQMTQGALSDRFGRRLPLVIGTVIYTLASAGCALAPNLFVLSSMRALEGFGGSASMVLARAIVRDIADGHAAARLMSQLILVMGAAPILAPSLGGLILGFGNWHTIFWICTGYGVVCCVLVMLVLPETLPSARRLRLSLGGQFARYGAIIRERGFITNAWCGSSMMFAMFAYLGGSPIVFQNVFHLSPQAFGALFGTCAFGLIAASQINPRLLRRFGIISVLRMAVRVSLAATVVLSVLAFAHAGIWWVVALPVFVSLTCQGFISANAAVGALSRHAAHAGSASALFGTMQFGFGSISGLVVGVLDDGTARPMALLMFAGMLSASIADLLRPRPA